MRRLLLALPFLALSIPTAHASGGLDCAFNDKTAEFATQMAVSHGLGSQISSLQGELTLKDKAFPKGIAKIEFTSENLIHHWLADKSANLHFWKDGGDTSGFGEMELIITAKEVPGEFYAAKGTYELILRYMKNPGDAEATVITRKGKVACGGE